MRFTIAGIVCLVMMGAVSRAGSPETVAARIRRALPYVPAERIVVAPDCGLKYLPREVAYGKMRAMVEGAKIVRQELGSK